MGTALFKGGSWVQAAAKRIGGWFNWPLAMMAASQVSYGCFESQAGLAVPEDTCQVAISRSLCAEEMLLEETSCTDAQS